MHNYIIHAGNIVIGEVQSEKIGNTFAMFQEEGRSLNQLFLQTNGIYLFSHSVPDSGKIFQISSFGYFSDESLEREGVIPYLFIVVFRYEAESGSHQLIHGPEELTHIFTPGFMAVEWPVQRGDMVGALIPNSCKNLTLTSIGCPSQINLRTDPWDCSSALYYPFNTDMGFDSEDLRSIPDDEFEEVQVKLSMEVFISPNGM